MTKDHSKKNKGVVMSNCVRKLSLLTSASCALFIVQPAWSQDAANAAAAAEQDMSDIIVTAQKRSQSINDVGLSITAATGDELVSRGVSDTSQLAKIVPGFSFNQTAQGSPVYTIRGVGYQDSSIAASPAVTVYVDEVPIPYPGGTLGAALDLERVEVLKGPQGTLFGGNSTGGAINYIAAKPTDHLAGSMGLSYGRFDTVDLTGSLSGPITDTLKARISGRWLRGGDWQRSYTRNDGLGDRDQLFGRLLVDWTPTDRLKFSFNVNGWRDRSDSQAPQLIGRTQSGLAPFDPEFLAQPFAPANARAADWNRNMSFRQDNSFWLASGRADYEISDQLTLTSITAYQEYKRYLPVDLDGTDQQVFLAINSGKVDSFYQEVRLNADLGGRGNILVGVNYQDDKIHEDYFADFSESTQSYLGRKVTTTNDQRAKTKAVFASGEYEIIPTLSVVGGIRYTEADRKFSGCTRDTGDGVPAAVFNALFNSGAVPGGCLTLSPTFQSALFNDKLDENNVSWRAGLNYKPNNDILLYANVSKGYKSGSYQSLPAASSVAFAPVTQESVLAYEAGFKVSAFNHKVQLNGAAFYLDYRDKQIRSIILDPIFGSSEGLINVPKSRIAGFELSGTFRPFDGLKIAPSITLVDSKVRGNLFTVTPDSTLVNARGEAFPYTPRWSGNTDVEYRWALSDKLEAFIGGSATYQTRTNGGFGEVPTYRVRGYTLVDLRAGIEGENGRWNASIWGRNVTNVYYWNTATRASDAATRFAGMPVTYGFTLGYRF